jgi:biotin-(acetyl-CoA carboxylase) ligase
LIVGIGVNLNLPAAALPAHADLAPTSLQAAIGRTVDRQDFITRTSERIAARLEHLRAAGLDRETHERIEAYLAWRGKTVTLGCDATGVTGEVCGIDDRGQLRLRTEQGVVACEGGEMRCHAGAFAETA